MKSFLCCFACYTFSPFFGQFVITTSVKIFPFCCKPFVEPFFLIFVRTKALLSKCVNHRSKHVEIVFLPKRFGLAVDVDGAPRSTDDFCARGSQNKSTFHPLSSYSYTMQKELPFVPREQNFTCVFVLFIFLTFNSRGTHPSLFLIFPISCSRLETACGPTPNCSASCFCVCESSTFSNSCNSTSLNFLTVFRVPCRPSFLVSKYIPHFILVHLVNDASDCSRTCNTSKMCCLKVCILYHSLSLSFIARPRRI